MAYQLDEESLQSMIADGKIGWIKRQFLLAARLILYPKTEIERKQVARGGVLPLGVPGTIHIGLAMSGLALFIGIRAVFGDGNYESILMMVWFVTGFALARLYGAKTIPGVFNPPLIKAPSHETKPLLTSSRDKAPSHETK